MHYYVSIFAGSEKNPALFSHKNLCVYCYSLIITFYFNWIFVSPNRLYYGLWYKEPGYVEVVIVYGQMGD